MKNKTLFRIILFPLISIFVSSCSPIKTSSKDEKHQMELSLHEVQINVDDLKHDLSCFKTDLQIIDGKLRNGENQIESIKQHQFAQAQAKIDGLNEKIKSLETKIAELEKTQQAELKDLDKLSFHAKEITSSLSQFREKLIELEGSLIVQNKRFDEVKKLKQTLEEIATSLNLSNDNYCSYKVKAGDSLEKIAKINKISVERLKKVNNLDQDLIVVGQELKVPKQ